MRVTTRPGRRRRRLTAALAALVVVGALGISSRSASAEDGGTSDAPILGIWEVQSLNGVNNNPYSPRAGTAGATVTCASGQHPIRGRTQRAGVRTQRTQRLQPDLQRQQRQRLLGAWRDVSGDSCGASSSTTPSVCARRTAPQPTSRSAQPIRSSRSATTWEWSRSSARLPHRARVSSNARQHVNTLTSFIDAEAVYGNTDTRLDWLRERHSGRQPGQQQWLAVDAQQLSATTDSRGNPGGRPDHGRRWSPAVQPEQGRRRR